MKTLIEIIGGAGPETLSRNPGDDVGGHRLANYDQDG